MARLSHYAALRHACVCVRYVQVRATTCNERFAARLTVSKVTDEPATSGTDFDLGGKDLDLVFPLGLQLSGVVLIQYWHQFIK